MVAYPELDKFKKKIRAHAHPTKWENVESNHHVAHVALLVAIIGILLAIRVVYT